MLFLISFLFLFLFLINEKENFKPDEKKYQICGDEINYNNNNYKVIKNNLGEPLRGFYSSLLDHAHNRDYNKYFNTPICEYRYGFENDYMDMNRIKYVSDMSDKEKKRHYFNESLLIENELYNPFEKYAGVNENYSVEYQEDSVKRRFIDGHKKMHEND